MALFLAGVAELNGADRKILGWMLGGLFALRVAHVEGGLNTKDSMGCGRKIGYLGTQAWMVGMTAWCAALVRDYWGF